MIHEETEKHSQIMASAAALFARQGYKKTTVDEIVAIAGISKGLFYHYYANKKELYLSLYNTYLDILSTAIRKKVDISERDFFLRLRQITHIRMEFMEEYPNLWVFLYSAYREDHPDIEPAIREKNKLLLQDSDKGSAANIDWSKLKQGVTPEKAIEITTWIAEGFMRKAEENHALLHTELFREFDSYMDCLMTGMYESGKEQ